MLAEVGLVPNTHSNREYTKIAKKEDQSRNF